MVHGSEANVVVPSLKGLTLADAQSALAGVGLGLEVAAGSTDSAVVSQTPAAGAALEIGGLVSLTLGRNRRRRALPRAVGRRRARRLTLSRRRGTGGPS